MSRKVLLLGHRGYSAQSPENTQLSFDAAHLFGFDGVELDVHLSKDNELVIIHDETTGRTGGKNYEVRKTNLNDLSRVDLSNFWKYKLPAQKIMTLQEFLDRYIDKFKMINIEIKTDVYHYPNIEKIINDTISKYDDKQISKLVFSSFNFSSLEILHNINPKLKLAFLWWTKSQFNKIDPSKFKFINYFNPWIDIYYKDQKKYDSYNKKYLFWTLKSENKYRELEKNKLTEALISNYLF
ncbi:glycerophosphoryl diester phosphodiesterase [Mycoplasma testudineum]|uniref:Glycerophosphoryl diester phosphodiesterase n=1 Tax=Mycoplasma testudineum TaxID=244584 RepID=A0A4R6IFL8_9MOLU|nr:glycerophosphodiester phosphodiesterase family protein [Mycoplasma testudineum]OYD26888.1 hypothetical protein CG473_00930 [Mycoplasma testudineum]TDO20437.1 glycerophosphoryl diester phosphodiesterase [Mycoplasma testudineum]